MNKIYWVKSYRGIGHENFTCIFNSLNRCSNIYPDWGVDDLDGLLSGGVVKDREIDWFYLFLIVITICYTVAKINGVDLFLG